MFYRQPAPPPPQSKLKRYAGKCWYFCVKFKINCSISMLLVFALFMVYLNDNYVNLTISIPSTVLNFASFSGTASSSSSTSSKSTIGIDAELSYLHPFAFRSVGSGSCQVPRRSLFRFQRKRRSFRSLLRFQRKRSLLRLQRKRKSFRSLLE